MNQNSIDILKIFQLGITPVNQMVGLSGINKQLYDIFMDLVLTDRLAHYM